MFFKHNKLKIASAVLVSAVCLGGCQNQASDLSECTNSCLTPETELTSHTILDFERLVSLLPEFKIVGASVEDPLTLVIDPSFAEDTEDRESALSIALEDISKALLDVLEGEPVEEIRIIFSPNPAAITLKDDYALSVSDGAYGLFRGSLSGVPAGDWETFIKGGILQVVQES